MAETEDLIAGFDAGQTHTSCRLAATDGRVLGEGEGPGVSHLAAEGGAERFRQALHESLAAARTRLDPEHSGLPLGAAAVGASGIELGSETQTQALALAAEALGLPQARLHVTGDERTALRGAFPTGAGIVVISGTGTIAVGRDGQGREHRCAGWGWLLDGAGSAYDIGRDGLALTLQMADGRVAPGPLQASLWGFLGLRCDDPAAPQAIKARVVAAGFAPAGLAKLAPLVDAAAFQGDAAALGIVSGHAEALVASVRGVARALALEQPAVAPLGGALTHLTCFRQQFGAALGRTLPGARLTSAAGDASSGALALARERLDGR